MTRQNGNISGDAEKYIRKVTWVGLAANFALSVIKFGGGILGSSQALVADAVHSISDTSTDIAVIVGSHYWAKPPDEDHPYGHRRMETLVTIFIGFVLLAAGLGIGWKAFSAYGETNHGPPGKIAVFVAAVSVVCKEILYRWTAKVGMVVRSAALAANAWHHRLDAISSIPVLVAVGSAILFPSWVFLDQIAAVVVSIFIIQAAVKIIWPGIRELMEAGAPREACERIKTIALGNDTVRKVHGIRTRYLSNGMLVDLNIVVDGSITVIEGHDAAEDVKKRIIEGESDVLDVIVHVDPLEDMNYEENC